MRDALLLHRHALILAGALAGYGVLLWTNPIRASLRDGLRCLRRYRQLWSIPALFGFCYAAFQLAVRIFYFHTLPEGGRPSLEWHWNWTFPDAPAHLAEVHTLGDWLTVLRDDPWIALVRESGVEALESLAGVFNNVVTTFPFSALAAVLLLCNYDAHHTTLRCALRARFGRAGWLAHAGILLCAVAAILKPVLFGPSLPELNRIAPGLLLLRWSSLIDSLSFWFEYLFGTCIQIYLILIVYAWVRGLAWTRRELLDVAIRRFSFVVKWAAAVMVASTVLIHVPLAFALLCRFDDAEFLQNTFLYIDHVARPLLALLLIAFASVQITLTFHSESLPKALADHARFLRRNLAPFLWFLLLAGLHFFLLALANQSVVRGFGAETATASAWSLVYPLLAAALAAWLLASWVCLYKRSEAGRLRRDLLIRF